MSRRSSACAVAAMLALSNISSAVPVPAADTCVDDAPIQALQANEPAASLFCKDYAPWGTPEITDTVTSTKTVGSVTETSMVTSTPLVDITVAADFVVQLTTTALCSAEAQATGAAKAADAGSDPPSDAPSEHDAAPPDPASATFVGVSVQNVNAQVTAAPSSSAHAAATPNGPVQAASAPAPAHTEPAHVAHGRHDVPLPSYVASFAPEQVSSACSCLSSKAGPATTTTTTTVTATIETVTNAYTTVHNTPILRYHNINFTATKMQTACISPTATAAAA